MTTDNQMPDLAGAALARAAGTATLSDRPRERRWCPQAAGIAAVRVALTPQLIRKATKDGVDGVMVGGVASTTEDPYEMYDYYGPYTEIVSAGAFAATLAADPIVEFTLNHGAGGGLPMAHTRNSTLTLSETDVGLDYEAFVDPSRSDVANMLKALERGDLAEASFRFRITLGRWSPDYMEYRIEAVDLDRGDVSAVNFGANPHATSGLRFATAPNLEEMARAIRQLQGTSTIFPPPPVTVPARAVRITDEDCKPR